MKTIIIIYCLLITSIGSAQNKYGKNWIISEPKTFLTQVRNINGVVKYTLKADIGLPPFQGYKLLGDGRNNICDSASGELLFISNGMHILDTNLLPLDNSDSLVSPHALANWDVDWNNRQGTLILPKANRKFDVFFPFVGDATIDSFRVCDLFLHHVVDMNANNGAGSVVKKQEDLLHGMGHLSLLNMDAVRHANGKDWWILKLGWGMGDYFDSVYLYTWLVKEDTIEGPFAYYAGPQFNTIQACGLNGRMADLKFSLDGTKFAGIHGCHSFYYGNFNRCTGAISNLVVNNQILVDSSYYNYGDTIVHYDSSFKEGCTGINFSPNNKYIYIATTLSVYQFEVAENDSLQAWIRLVRLADTIDQYCYYKGSLRYGLDSTLFIFRELGVYENYLSAIQYPDLKGKSCNYQTNMLIFPTGQVYPYIGNPPNHPNWLLGADSTLCWPLSINQIASNKHSWSIYPNPTQNTLTVLFTSTLITTQKIEIYNMQGQLVQQCFANKGQSKYNVSLQVPSGIYIVKINNESKRLVVE
jgi:hypothetical protein